MRDFLKRFCGTILTFITPQAVFNDLEAMSMDEMMLELKKWEEPTPPEEEVLAQIYNALYKKYIS